MYSPAALYSSISIRECTTCRWFMKSCLCARRVVFSFSSFASVSSRSLNSCPERIRLALLLITMMLSAATVTVITVRTTMLKGFESSSVPLSVSMKYNNTAPINATCTRLINIRTSAVFPGSNLFFTELPPLSKIPYPVYHNRRCNYRYCGRRQNKKSPTVWKLSSLCF